MYTYISQRDLAYIALIAKISCKSSYVLNLQMSKLKFLGSPQGHKGGQWQSQITLQLHQFHIQRY